MDTEQFIEQLDAEVGRYDLLCHPFYQAWSAGTLTRANLREYAVQYYHHVSAFPTYLSALHAGLPDGALRRAVLKNLCEEELDRRPHAEIWLDFAEGMGASRAAVQNRAPIRPIETLISTFRRLVATPASGLAALYTYESQIPRIARAKTRGLKQRYGADDRTCRYFDLHKTADVKHARVWKRQLAGVLAAEPALAAEALGAARRAGRALWRALDGVEALRKAQAS